MFNHIKNVTRPTLTFLLCMGIVTPVWAIDLSGAADMFGSVNSAVQGVRGGGQEDDGGSADSYGYTGTGDQAGSPDSESYRRAAERTQRETDFNNRQMQAYQERAAAEQPHGIERDHGLHRDRGFQHRERYGNHFARGNQRAAGGHRQSAVKGKHH
jgi:hypothetical protein